MSVISQDILNTTGLHLPPLTSVVIIHTEWNAATVNKLYAGSRKILDTHKVNHHSITVPGAFEIPFAIKTYWDVRKYHDEKPAAFIALGCVLRGDTPHFDFVCKAITDGILQLNLTLPIPTIFGILTVDNQAQADERVGGKHGHKGEEAAITALKMIALNHSIKKNNLPAP